MKYILILLITIMSLSLYSQNNGVDLSEMQKKGELYFYNGEKYTGASYKNFKSGEKGMEGRLLNGYKDAEWIWFYKNGKEKRKSNFVDGQLNGISTYWYKNGVKRSEITFRNGVNIKQIRWDESGKRLPPPSFE